MEMNLTRLRGLTQVTLYLLVSVHFPGGNESYPIKGIDTQCKKGKIRHLLRRENESYPIREIDIESGYADCRD